MAEALYVMCLGLGLGALATAILWLVRWLVKYLIQVGWIRPRDPTCPPSAFNLLNNLSVLIYGYVIYMLFAVGMFLLGLWHVVANLIRHKGFGG